MRSNSSGVNLILGLVAVGGVVVTSGVWLYRRSRAGRADDTAQDGQQMEVMKGAGGDENLGKPQVAGAQHGVQQARPLTRYFLLVGAISIPFWLLGGNKLPLPVDLPASALMFVSPALAASILVYRQNGWSGIRTLLKKAVDFPKIRNYLWYLPILLLLPFIYLLSYVVMRLTGQALPEPVVPLTMIPVFFALYLIPAICEELGWSGYAIDPMQTRWGALRAAVLLGLIWSLWHIIPDIQNGKAADWIFWHRLSAVALRVVIVWVYNNTGKSVSAAILVHTVDNVSVSLFPIYGSHYNPLVTGAINWLAVGLVVFGWRAETLARLRWRSS